MQAMRDRRLWVFLMISLLLCSISKIALAETGAFQESGRISAYAITFEGEYVYIVGDAVNQESALSESFLDLGGGMRDIWLIKMRLDGTPVYSALIGGANDDSAYDLVVREGVVYILGETWSRDFPGASGNAGENDAILIALAADGEQILWARRLGGSDQDSGRALSMYNGDLFLTGITWSEDLVPGEAEGDADGFLARVALDGSLSWLNIFGGRLLDAPFDLIIYEDDLWVAGQSFSRDFGGTHQGEGDAFAARFNLAGEEIFARLYGGREADIAYAISSGEEGIFLAGGTQSGALPDADGDYGGNYDGFLMKMNADGNMQSISYLGGTGNDYAHDIVLLPGGDLLVVGGAFSPYFPLGYDEPQEILGEGDVFIVQTNPQGEVMSYWLKGGGEEDRARSAVLTSIGLWMAGSFSLETGSFGLLVPFSELEGIPSPSPEPIQPTATLALTATPQPTETPLPTITQTPQPTAALTGTSVEVNTATPLGSETTPAESSVTPMDDTRTESAVAASEKTPRLTAETTATAGLDGLGEEIGEVNASPENEKSGEISTGLVLSLALLLAAVSGGAYYWFRHKK